MHDLFPLSEHLWLQWLEDAAETGEGSMPALFDLAVQDYLSVPIWQQYLRYGSRVYGVICCVNILLLLWTYVCWCYAWRYSSFAFSWTKRILQKKRDYQDISHEK